MDVSIIIVNYNTAELLINCIDSIQTKTSGLYYEIIVVDNKSSDNSVILLKEKFNNVIVIESDINLGFGKGNNLGAQYAKGKYLFFLNSDTILINNAIKILFDFIQLKGNENVACVGGNLYHPDGRPNYSYASTFPTLSRMILYRSGLRKLIRNDNFNTTGKPKTVAIIIGADMLIPKEKFNQINGFDPNYFMYVEESDLQYRFRLNGWQSQSLPTAKIIHLQGASSSNAFKLRSEIKSYFLYYNKFYNRRTVFLYKHIELTFAILKYILFFIMGKQSSKEMYAEAIKLIRGSS
ncbi:glycosyltransferase family 2 protein [Dyadobacter sp. 32]|uniref:glycosyltransferase family 2 protein n=1 Tax=Dyadobacter sp. 32 TaxID=538966 RepID=UPI0011EF7CA7